MLLAVIQSEIWVGNKAVSTGNSINSNTLCYKQGVTNTVTIEYPCNEPIRGRYVTAYKRIEDLGTQGAGAGSYAVNEIRIFVKVYNYWIHMKLQNNITLNSS